ncbi:cyclic-AMP phosphodiesterase, class-II [Pseudomassariella vexata]|uniref:Cyclic-AMP phosphodiesterase, class-II n=1 Tax=Pseudomassariella vexata TaxID=1141098 RepID=A0A1Y2EGW2_9PEZI|nr:cyclic-AMP phosphodiesterase, class-II [Pseudomassariella vexata]ORY70025.1 cyclic-AMP phosphodiesterase, class-II [Pseudomassariella vexata]
MTGEAEKNTEPALQVIVLGSGGGPQEHNVTALLVRSTSSGWGRGSIVALDAGVHLSAIRRILEGTQPKGLGVEVALPHKLETGPFAGMKVESSSAAANAVHITRSLIDTYLITHPHLDHISGFVINTAGLPGSRPKRLAGLPSTISAFKTHIFNNVIWPNLSDENNGAGLVTYMRLVEGGSPALGEGEGKGYIEISDGLATKIYGVSHGHCIENHSHRGSTSSSRFGSTDVSTISSRGVPGSNAASGHSPFFRTSSMAYSTGNQDRHEGICVYDSSAYFIRDTATGREVLIFGDVEPDTMSLSPRNLDIWKEAAPKIVSGQLAAIFIECSYSDSQTNDRLFGHLAPRFIIEEMQALAQQVEISRRNPIKLTTTKKRKRELEEAARRANKAATRSTVDDHPVSPKSFKITTRGSISGSGATSEDDLGPETPHIATPTDELTLKELNPTASVTVPSSPQMKNPLRELKIVIIHVKDNFSDVEPAGDMILTELIEYEKEAQLGCEFIISHMGQSFMF